MYNKIPSKHFGNEQTNMENIYFTKVVSACSIGVVCGALGLLHVNGLILMAIVYCIVSAGLFVLHLTKLDSQFESRYTPLTDSFFPFVLVCFFYY